MPASLNDRAKRMPTLRVPRVRTNALMGPRLIRQYCGTAAPDNVLRVARTIADLAGSESIQPDHLSEALALRME